METVNDVILVEFNGKRFKVRIMEEQMVINTILRTDCACKGCREKEDEMIAEDEDNPSNNQDSDKEEDEADEDTHEHMADTERPTLAKEGDDEADAYIQEHMAETDGPLW